LITGKLLITGNSILSHSNGNEDGLVVEAAVVQVDEGSAIDVTGRGYIGGKNTNEAGRTLNNASGSTRGAGGGYGGPGGSHGGASNLVYGDPKAPNKLGSGGADWDGHDGGDGGGRISLIASEKVVVNGGILANGGESAGSAAGNGSGGSIRIQTSRLEGKGRIAANGGGNDTGVGGGGGRIGIFCDYVDSANNLNHLYNITVFSGRGQYDDRKAGAGTVYIKYNTQMEGDLYIDDNIVDQNGDPSGTAAVSTPLPQIGFGATAAIGENTLTTNGLVAMMPGGMVGLRINPHTAQGETFAVQANTGNTLTVVTPNENGVTFSNVAAVGREYAGYYAFDNLIFRRGGSLVTGDLLEVKDTLNLSEYGHLTHFESDTVFVSQLNLKVGSLLIDEHSRIDVTGRGYIGGRNTNEAGRTLGNVYGSTRGAGGSYGGLGGSHNSAVPNALYGSLTNPSDLGSGGADWDGFDGGDGGGRIFIQAEDILLNGVIRANGGESAGAAAGDGSGGTVRIQTESLDGTGIIEANGGGNNSGVGGGGGRIAVSAGASMALPQGNIKVLQGIGQYGSGSTAGTIDIKP
jgi:hypothetical protein